MQQHQYFARLQPRNFIPHAIWQGNYGLSISSSCTSYAGLATAVNGNPGTELVIGQNNDLKIDFGKEVDRLMMEFYVVSDRLEFDEDDLIECEYRGRDPELLGPPPLYWLTLSGLAGTEIVPGHYASSPTRQLLLGPFRTLTISTTQAGTVHIPALSWQPAVRH